LWKVKTPRWRVSAGEDGFVGILAERLSRLKTLRPADEKGARGGSKP
jgi:hypothetical protein